MRRLVSILICAILLGGCAEKVRPEADTLPRTAAATTAADAPEPGAISPDDTSDHRAPMTVTAVGDTVRNYGGFLLTPIDAGWAIHHIERNGEHEIILRRQAGRTPEGRSRWIEHDTVVVAEWGPDHFLSFQACKVYGRPDSAMVAVFEYQELPILRGAQEAWRVDSATAALVPLDASAVECENEEYGV